MPTLVETLNPGSAQDLETQLFRSLTEQFANLADIAPRPVPQLDVRPSSSHEWLMRHFRSYYSDTGGSVIPFADFHMAFWEWLWTIETERPAPFVGIWPRGAGKSTNAEIACVYLEQFHIRRFGLYICATQQQADDHVQNIADLLESPSINVSRMVGKYGHSRGWRRNRLRTDTGFMLESVGLDTASARGVKFEDARPDFMILDDLDSESDTEYLVQKKIRALTRKLLPTGTETLAVLAIQNLIHDHGIFAQLSDGRADFLSDRIISGPHPALKHLRYTGTGQQAELLSGEPTWAGMTLANCQDIVKNEGLAAFLTERQHEKDLQHGALLGDVWNESIHFIEPFELPPSWRMFRSFDWGETKPFSVGWWAESDGSPLPDGRLYYRGTIFRIAEWYGWNGKPNQGLRLSESRIAEGILLREKDIGLHARIRPGPAGADLFTAQRGVRLADEFARKGVHWLEADVRPGSRKAGARRLKMMLQFAKGAPMEGPGFFVFNVCTQWKRCVPSLPRDPRDPEDAWSDAEDHNYDETRYGIMQPKHRAVKREVLV